MSGAVHSEALTRPGLVHGIFAWSTHSVLASWMSVGRRTLSGFSPAGRAASVPVADGDTDGWWTGSLTGCVDGLRTGWPWG